MFVKRLRAILIDRALYKYCIIIIIIIITVASCSLAAIYQRYNDLEFSYIPLPLDGLGLRLGSL